MLCKLRKQGNIILLSVRTKIAYAPKAKDHLRVQWRFVERRFGVIPGVLEVPIGYLPRAHLGTEDEGGARLLCSGLVMKWTA